MLQEVERKFERYGDVVEARIVRNPHNGESRGFGFVEMKTDDGADEVRLCQCQGWMQPMIKASPSPCCL